MKKLSFILALIIALTGMIGLFATSVSAAEDAGYTYDEATDTYTVTTTAGYAAAVALMNGTSKETANLDATLKLAADLDFTGVDFPILALGNANGYFTGTLDGDGYTMSNITIVKDGVDRVGIVGESAGGTFKNITIVDSSISAKTYVALFVGDVRSGSNPVTFENCHVKNVAVYASSQYPCIFGTTNTAPLTIKNSTVIDAAISTPGGQAGVLFNERGSTVGLEIAVENVFVTGTVTSKTNAGAIGYTCDDTITLTNVITLVEASDAANTSSLLSNVKRCAVTMNNVVCIGSPIASADALGEKAANDFVLNNVVAVADEAPKAFKAFAINGTKAAPTLTIDGVAAEFASATIPAITMDAVAAKLTTVFANSEAVRLIAAAETFGYYYDAGTDTYNVVTADGLIAVAADIKARDIAEGTDGVNGSSSNKEDATIVLVADIDMNDATGKWDPICNYSNGVFVGTIDGQGHTIYNFTDINASANRRGLIARAGACTVKNLTFVDAVVTGKDNTAVIVADIFGGAAGETTTIENCKVINATVTGGSYTGSLIGKGTKELNVVIKNCVVEATVSGGAHVGFLIGGEAAGVNTTVYTIEDIVASGTVSGATNAGLTGYFCDITVNFKNIVSRVEALKATNTSSVMANAKRCAVTMNNVVCIDSPIASADGLGEKVANDFVLNNVVVIAAEAQNAFKAFVINGTVATPVLTINGEAADFATATVPAITSGLAHVAVKTAIFADNAALRDAALAIIPHEHVFNQEVATEAYFNAAATCTAKATYFFSCDCTEKGTETFEYGDMLPHTPGKTYNNDGAQHWVACTKCDTKLYSDHVYDQEVAGDEYLITPAGCTTRAEFFKSCKCGAKGEESFKAVGVLGHFWGEWTTAVEPTVDAEGVAEKVCATCGEKETKTIEKLPAPEAPAVEPGIIDQVKAMAGCGGSIGGASIIIMIAAAGAVVLRKKED